MPILIKYLIINLKFKKYYYFRNKTIIILSIHYTYFKLFLIIVFKNYFY